VGTTHGGDPGPLRVGVAGAGPWAGILHAPMFAAHPATELTAVWGRRLTAAATVAGASGATAFDSFDAFLDQVDAVAFAVPPDVQADLALRAARAGKALLLEKPLALDVPAAADLARAVAEHGVGTQMVLTWRYAAAVRSFVDAARASRPTGGRGWFLSGTFLGGPFATPWRLDRGALFDLGPHVIDLLDAALGPVVDVRAHGDPRRWVGLLLEHGSGVVSEASLTGRSGVVPARAGAEVHDGSGALDVDTSGFDPAVGRTIVDEFVDTARGVPHPLDVRHGLRLQEIVARAAGQLVWT
jgi:predicted dehydrogenase